LLLPLSWAPTFPSAPVLKSPSSVPSDEGPNFADIENNKTRKITVPYILIFKLSEKGVGKKF
jgi:hypothetical protein